MFNMNKVDRGTEFFIFDVYVAILKIKKVVSKFDNVESLIHSFTNWDSVIREFEIIGEACKYLIRDNLLDTNYRRIIDFRNNITHEYFGIDRDIVWEIIHQKLDEIEEIIVNLIINLRHDLKQELIYSFIEDNKYLDFVVEALEELK